jgi:hypothetical protein
LNVEYELVKWFVKEKLPSDVVRYDGILEYSQGYRFYGSYPTYVDLLVETKSEFWIVEAKTKWDNQTVYSAAGQLLFYQHLWNTYNENAGQKKLRLVCLCRFECSEDAKEFLELYDIRFVKGDVPRD